jgi:hypothetical protein
MPSRRASSSRGLLQRLLDNELSLSRFYAAAAGLALLQTVVLAPAGQRLLATIIAIGLLPVAAMIILFVVGFHIVINPIWGPTATRIFMSIIIVLAPLMVVAALVVFFFAPPELLSSGNGGVTGWVGFAWAAHYLYRRHGLSRPISPFRFWQGILPSRSEGTQPLQS